MIFFIKFWIWWIYNTIFINFSPVARFALNRGLPHVSPVMDYLSITSLELCLICYFLFNLCHFLTVKCNFINGYFQIVDSIGLSDYSSVLIGTNAYKVSYFRYCKTYLFHLFCNFTGDGDMFSWVVRICKKFFRQLYLRSWTLDSCTIT